jgi:hypothetical protein
MLKKFIFALIALGLTGALLEVLSRSAETSALLEVLSPQPLDVDFVGTKYPSVPRHLRLEQHGMPTAQTTKKGDAEVAASSK